MSRFFFYLSEEEKSTCWKHGSYIVGKPSHESSMRSFRGQQSGSCICPLVAGWINICTNDCVDSLERQIAIEGSFYLCLSVCLSVGIYRRRAALGFCCHLSRRDHGTTQRSLTEHCTTLSLKIGRSKNAIRMLGHLKCKRSGRAFVTLTSLFTNFRASLSWDQRILRCSEMSCNGLWSSKVVKGLVVSMPKFWPTSAFHTEARSNHYLSFSSPSLLTFFLGLSLVMLAYCLFCVSWVIRRRKMNYLLNVRNSEKPSN